MIWSLLIVAIAVNLMWSGLLWMSENRYEDMEILLRMGNGQYLYGQLICLHALFLLWMVTRDGYTCILWYLPIVYCFGAVGPMAYVVFRMQQHHGDWNRFLTGPHALL